MLGSAITQGLLRNRHILPEHLWISNRSGEAPDLDEWIGIHVTSRNQELVDACNIVLLSVPPQLAPSLEINAQNRLIVSLMAGITMEQIGTLVRADRIVRAMSSPAAEFGLAYSPWCPSAGVTDEDRASVRGLLGALGETDEVPSEEQIDLFTALTGPVPGFVAYYAECMVQYAMKRGVDPGIAERAIRQLFYASGTVLARSPTSAGDHVREMIDYAGTTAAGLEAMKALPLAATIEQGLDAAFRKAQH